nr:protein FRG2-like [Rattus norvegicus]XP_038948519.1 protein FRG2-like [Rattus norvegicus]|eukprot:XP_006251491.1 PREDICTED: protein FRG2-like [Rattus norvegicus]
MDSETSHPDPSCQTLDPPTGPQSTVDERTSESEPNKNERTPSQSDSNSSNHTEESTQKEAPRKRKHSSRDSSQVRTGSEGSSHGKKRHKTSETKAEPRANGHQDGLSHRPQHTDPLPIRKNLVSFLREKSEEIYRDTVQMQAQQHGSLLSPEQLSQLSQLSGSLTAVVHTFYSMATQAGFAFPAEGWLIPGTMPAPQELSGKEPQSPLVEGGEKTTDSASPSSPDKTSPEPRP